MPTDSDTLASALSRHGVELDADQIEALDRYCRALWDWNAKLNLTRHTDYEKFVTRDVVDSLQLEPFLASGERVLDVGTGGGVPGIVLAIARPDLAVSLCESVAKKARAVGDIVTTIGLDIPVYHARAESVLEAHAFDTLVVRAVAPLWKLLSWLRPHWAAFAQLLVIKGPSWAEERKEARERRLLTGLTLRKAAEYNTPGTGAASVVLRITPADGNDG